MVKIWSDYSKPIDLKFEFHTLFNVFEPSGQNLNKKNRKSKFEYLVPSNSALIAFTDTRISSITCSLL